LTSVFFSYLKKILVYDQKVTDQRNPAPGCNYCMLAYSIYATDRCYHIFRFEWM